MQDNWKRIMTNTKYERLRKEHPIFEYQAFDFSMLKHEINIQFYFAIGAYEFHPKMKLALGKYAIPTLQENDIRGLVFQIGLIELISYWKCTCSPTLLIRPYTLSPEMQDWWKKLYFNGLGEFFYQNKIQTSEEDFLHFEFAENSTEAATLYYPHILDNDKVIVPIGGGKDSVVTLEALRKERQVIPFIINPRGATLDCARIAGFPAEDDIVVLHREIAPQLLDLNQQGFLNGHTPFSAMLSFYTLLVSYGTNTREVALSNESSANEPTIPGTKINHQYSKTLEYEEDFRYYVKNFLNDSNHYYSYLRPYTELQIAEMFARHPQYFPVFKSCNAGSKENKWCCNCSKCLFAYIILSPFIDNDTMVRIFGEDLLDKPELQQYFDELRGVAPNKPFECVGTIDEVNKALEMIRESRKNKVLISKLVNVPMC